MSTADELFINARSTQLGDVDGTTWANETMIVALNQAIRLLVLKRPDSSYKIQTILLKKGSRQNIPADGVSLINVVRNINSDDSIGDSIREISKRSLDSMFPGWHKRTATLVEEYCADQRAPKHFYVYPSPAADDTVKIEIEYSAMPNPVTRDTVSEELPFDPIYDQPLIEFMLYKLLSGDNATGGANGGIHLKTALDLLDVKSVSDNEVAVASKG